MTRGGLRQGAGRKKNSGLYKEETKPVRLPVRYIEQVKAYLAHLCEQASPALGQGIAAVSRADGDKPSLSLPLFASMVSAGYPTPADDAVEDNIDLNAHIIKRPDSTFLVTVSGDSMINAGIHNGDILVVDRAPTPKHNDVVIAVLNGELTVKRLLREHNAVTLKPENPDYPLIPISEDMDFRLWGVVTSVIHQL